MALRLLYLQVGLVAKFAIPMLLYLPHMHNRKYFPVGPQFIFGIALWDCAIVQNPSFMTHQNVPSICLGHWETHGKKGISATDWKIPRYTFLFY